MPQLVLSRVNVAFFSRTCPPVAKSRMPWLTAAESKFTLSATENRPLPSKTSSWPRSTSRRMVTSPLAGGNGLPYSVPAVRSYTTVRSALPSDRLCSANPNWLAVALATSKVAVIS